MSDTGVHPSAVVEALVREYLIKKGFTATLDSYNREKPKDASSITKRELLRKSLGLEKVAAKFKRTNPDSQLPTTLELFVEHQMSRVTNLIDSTRSLDLSESKHGNHVPVTASLQGQLPSSKMQSSSQGQDAMFQKSGQGLKLLQQQQPSPAKPASASSSKSAPAPAAAKPQSSSSQPAAARPASGGSSGKVRSSSPSTKSKPTGSSGAREPSPARSKPAVERSSAPAGFGLSPASNVKQAPKEPSLVSKPVKSAGPSRKPASKNKDDMVLEDLDADFGDDSSFSAPLVHSGRTLGRGGISGGQQIAGDLIKSIRSILWGVQSQPPPSWKQGFFFNSIPNLQFGLIQKQGGPCGVLAAVQAQVLAVLRTPDGFTLRPSPQQQQQALVTSIATILWQARGSSAAPAVLVTASLDGGGSLNRLDYNQLCRVMVQQPAATLSDLQGLVQSALSLFTEPDGWGIALLLASALLSRGPAMVQADMDEPSNSLMGAHGYCTQELVHLLLMGQAVSNVFDGTKKIDSTILRGVPRRCRLGCLTLFEWYKYVEVGRYLKDPDIPVWVVCAESHFTVLFAMDSRAMRNTTPFDLYYYDELANQDNIIKLTVKTDPAGGWTAKMGTTIGDRGKCEGQNIPPLECVIETKWPGVKVDWNGHDPIL